VRQPKDYSDFINFAKKHKDKSRTAIYNLYKKSGGHIGKAKALELSRGIEVKKSFKFEQKFPRRDIMSPAIQELQSNIKKLYGKTSKNYIQVHMQVENDSYTFNKHFSIMIPTNKMTKQKSVKDLGKTIIENMTTYYTNLAKRYRRKGIKETKNVVNDRLKELNKKIDNSRNISQSDLLKMFSKYGFNISDINLFQITNNHLEE
jgi:hypothetical protein